MSERHSAEKDGGLESAIRDALADQTSDLAWLDEVVPHVAVKVLTSKWFREARNTALLEAARAIDEAAEHEGPRAQRVVQMCSYIVRTRVLPPGSTTPPAETDRAEEGL